MNNKKLKSRYLRKNLTEAEKKLWGILRNKQLDGFRFRRQVPIGCYIVDFLCYENRLIIEVDGGHHCQNIEYDCQRTEWLEEQGFTVIRFWNNEVLKQLDAVREFVLRKCYLNSPHPNLPPQGGKGLDIYGA